KKMFRELKSDVDDNKPDDERTFKVKRLWHNTFNDIIGDGIDKYYKTFTASYTASQDGEPTKQVIDKLKDNLKKKGETEDEAEHVAYDVGLVLAGHGEARDLRDNHKSLFERHDIAALNEPFKKNNKPTLITAEMTPQPQTLDGLSFKVIGPMQAQIKALQDA